MGDIRHWLAMHAPEKAVGQLWSDIQNNYDCEFGSSIPWMPFTERYGFCLTEQVVRYIYADLMLAASEVNVRAVMPLRISKEQRGHLSDFVAKFNERIGGAK